MTAVLQPMDALRSDRMMAPHDDTGYSSSTDWKAKYLEVADMLTETRAELDEFHVSSKELEEELERELERTEKSQQELKIKAARAEQEKDDWKAKFMTLQTTHNTTTTSLQRELDTLRQDHQRTKTQLRELETGNDDLERNERAISSSLADVEQKYARVLEEKILLEHELLDKANIEEECQRLKDELRDANEEVMILKEQLSNALQKASSIDLPSTNTRPQSPSDNESLLSTPAPPNLNLDDLLPPRTPAKDLLPLKNSRSAQPMFTPPVSHAAPTHHAAFQPTKSKIVPPINTTPISLARSTTLPTFTGTPSRLPSRTPTTRPSNRTVSTMSSTSTITSTVARSRGVQMVSEMRARVKVLEQKIHTRVPLPRLRMGSVTNRSASSALPPLKAGPSSRNSSPSHSTPSSRLRGNSASDRGSHLKPGKQNADSDSENRRSPVGDTSGWVLIMEDSPSPVKDKDKERRRTSSPPSAFRALSNDASSSPSPAAGSRAPSVMSHTGIPSRRPQSRLSVSTEGRSSISTNATTSTTSSIPTPSSRPTTPTFLPVPTSSLYQSQYGLKKSVGPGYTSSAQQKRTSFGSSTTSSPTFSVNFPPPPLPPASVTLRSSSKGVSSLSQSRIGKPPSGRKGGAESSSLEVGNGKSGRGRAGSSSTFFGRNH